MMDPNEVVTHMTTKQLAMWAALIPPPIHESWKRDFLKKIGVLEDMKKSEVVGFLDEVCYMAEIERRVRGLTKKTRCPGCQKELDNGVPQT